MILARQQIGGEERPVVLDASGSGFLHVVDRETGRPLAVNPLVRMNWADGFDLQTGRPKVTPERPGQPAGAKVVFPSIAGARSWPPAAYDPERGLYFASVLDMGHVIVSAGQEDRPEDEEQAPGTGAMLILTPDLPRAMADLPLSVQKQVRSLPHYRSARRRPWSSELRAIGPLTGKARGVVEREGCQDRGGVLATASGLVRLWYTLGQAGRARCGERQAAEGHRETGSSMLAASMTFRADGEQYIAVQTGWGGNRWGPVPRYSAAYKRGNANRLLAFKLGGREVRLPPELPPLEVAPEAPTPLPNVTPVTLAYGAKLFVEHCAICHSNQLRAPVPDLRRMPKPVYDEFERIVLGGKLKSQGMPGWGDVLTEDQVKAIHAYLIDQQAKTRERELGLQAAGKPLDDPGPSVRQPFRKD